MFDSPVESSIGAESWEAIRSYDFIYADACAWMSQEMESFLHAVSGELNKAQRRIILPGCVRQELEKCAKEKYAARCALSLIDRYTAVIEEDASMPAVTTADRVFAQIFFRNHRKRRQLLITQDNQLALDIHNLCPVTKGEEASPSTCVLSLWSDGRPIDFAEVSRLREELARTRLDESVRTCPIYLDSTTLSSPAGAALLANLREPMARYGRKTMVLDTSLIPEAEDMLQEYLEGENPMVQVIPADPDMSETDALLGELYLGDFNMGVNRIILVTDDLARATELRDRRPRSDHFPQVDFMSANKYGFLSYMRMQRSTARPEQAAFGPGAPRREAMPRWTRLSDDESGARKASSFVPQLIGAIKNDDIESMCEYLDKGANVRNGIITALCNDKNDCLRVILERAKGEIEASCFRWWVVSFFSFSDPFYLKDNEEQYDLLTLLLEKSANLGSARNAMVVLCRQVSYAQAAHEQLWSVIRMAIGKGAPVDVTSQETGETLPEIARRQGNKSMEAFLMAQGL